MVMAERASTHSRAQRSAVSKPRPWTRADLARLPDDGNRYEVLNGELLVTPQANPVHQRIASELMLILEPYCQRHSLGVVVGPGAIPFGKNELQPDVQIIPCAIADLKRGWKRLPRPLLVIEILSEGSRHFDTGKKRDAYLDRGIADYWILDPDERSATMVRPALGDVTVEHLLTWRPAGVTEPLEIDLDVVFQGATGR